MELNNWKDIVTEFNRDDFVSGDWLFRGEHDASWEPQTSLERHTPKEVFLSRAEDKLLYEFKRRAHFYLAPEFIPDAHDDGEWLALMQHFGAPTRLLDMTRSPYLALYFAVENDAKDAAAVTHSSVLAINRKWCLTAAGEAIFKANPSARDQIKKRIGGRYPADIDAALAQGIDSSRLSGDVWRHNKAAVVVPYEPQKLSQRLSIQQGAFLVPRSLDVSFNKNLDALGESRGNVIKYRIPCFQRGAILERLRLMNITREQLFPGMDGFAQSFRQFLVRETDEQKNEREARETLRIRSEESMRLRTSTPAMAADTQNRMSVLLSEPTVPSTSDDDPKRT